MCLVQYYFENEVVLKKKDAEWVFGLYTANKSLSQHLEMI